MATKKKLLQAAAGSAGGAAALNVEDVFSTYLYEGNSDTQVIENGINLGQANYGKSIYFPDGDGDYLATATLPQFTGAFTYELWFYSFDNDRAIYLIDKNDRDSNFSIVTNYLTSFDQMFVRIAGTLLNYSSVGFDPDGWNHVAVVRDSSNNVATFVNGTRVTTTSVVSGTVNADAYYIGSNSSGAGASGYELMYGYMSSVRISDTDRYSTSSTSITTPTSEFTSDSNTVLLLGQGDTPLADASSNSYSVTVNGNPRASEVGPFDAAEAGKGGLVWFKNRSTADDHHLYDTERGTGKRISSNQTTAQYTGSSTYGLTSFNSSGFSVGSTGAVNNSGSDLASWTFRKAPKFFDVVTYTGDSVGSSAQTISHGLGSNVGMIIAKRTSTADNWAVWHRYNANGTGFLNITDAFYTNVSSSFISSVSSTSFTVGESLNTNGESFVAYLFAHNDGDGEFGPDGDADIIKCGSYTGTGSEMFIDLGFEPQWILTRRTDTTDNWFMVDTMRGIVSGGGEDYLWANTSNAEQATTAGWAVNPTGFTVESSSRYVSGGTYIYIAIRRGPMAVPTDATDVFTVHDQVGEPDTSPLYFNNDHVIDMVLSRNRYIGGGFNYITDRLRSGGTILFTDNTNAESSGLTYIEFDHNTNNYIPAGGYGNNSGGTSENSVFWQWKRAPNYFDVVAYLGNGTSVRNISHNLGVEPEMIWFKVRTDADNWQVYHKDVGANKALFLDNTNAAQTWGFMNNTAPTSSVFTTTSGYINAASQSYIAYLFASLDGVSKVGSFTAGVSDTFVDCGFSSSARFVLMKRSSGTGDWFVYDSERGYAAGANDKRLKINSTAAQTTNNNIDPTAGGFTVTGNTIDAGTYIFYAIA